MPQDGHATASPLVDARTTITSPASLTLSIDSADRPENTTPTSFAVSATNDHGKINIRPAGDPAPPPKVRQSR
ncbi:hypothetical protein [Alloactinosynnema sp. L-07]|nr:hypothetical protein [Alloactinosynnema sp. L-07]